MKPTFLGIGSQRCGTTWLYRVLSRHPDVFMPRVKEVKYFSERIHAHSLAWYEKRFGPPDNDPPRPIRGEFTPAYCTIPPEVVRMIATAYPELRLILMIRDPVERTWSQIKIFHEKLVLKNDLDAMLDGFVARDKTARFNDYLRTIEVWTAHFPEEALYIDLYDRVQADKPAVLAGVLAHLGADPTWQPEAKDLQAQINDTEDRDIPPILRWALAKAWIEPTKRLNDRLQGRVSPWIAEMDRILGEGRPPGAGNPLGHLISAPKRVVYHAYDTYKDRKLDARARELMPEAQSRSAYDVSTSEVA